MRFLTLLITDLQKDSPSILSQSLTLLQLFQLVLPKIVIGKAYNINLPLSPHHVLEAQASNPFL